jgi:hypothetical protein
MKRINREKDKLIRQTDNQKNPGHAKPEDFEVTSAADAAQMEVPSHGQHGKNKAEYTALLPKSKLIPERNDVNNRNPKNRISAETVGEDE